MLLKFFHVTSLLCCPLMSSGVVGDSQTVTSHGWAGGQRLHRHTGHVDRCNNRATPSSQGPADDEDEAVV